MANLFKNKSQSHRSSSSSAEWLVFMLCKLIGFIDGNARLAEMMAVLKADGNLYYTDTISRPKTKILFNFRDVFEKKYIPAQSTLLVKYDSLEYTTLIPRRKKQTQQK